VLRSILLIPGAVAATFSAFGHLGGVQEIAARSTMTDEAKNLLQSKLNVWLTKRGEQGGYVRTSVHTPFGTRAAGDRRGRAESLHRAGDIVGSMRGLYLTVAFNGIPGSRAHELLAVLHAHLQLVIEQSLQRGAMSAALRLRVAEKLVEPDFAKYPSCAATPKRCRALRGVRAPSRAVTPAEVENARIVGLVHDVRHAPARLRPPLSQGDITPEELAFLREHPAVGAAMVEPLLGAEIARAVLCHHERVDGRGYPNELHGDEIPLLSRILAALRRTSRRADRRCWRRRSRAR
jgi:hypothetical protein